MAEVSSMRPGPVDALRRIAECAHDHSGGPCAPCIARAALNRRGRQGRGGGREGHENLTFPGRSTDLRLGAIISSPTWYRNEPPRRRGQQQLAHVASWLRHLAETGEREEIFWISHDPGPHGQVRATLVDPDLLALAAEVLER